MPRSRHSRTSRARPIYLVGVCLAALLIVVAVWSLAPRYRASQGLVLTGKTLPPEAERDADSIADEHLQMMHARVMASMSQQIDARFEITGVDTAAPEADEPGSVSISFEVSVDDSDAGVAERSVEAIAAAYLHEHRESASASRVPNDELEAADVAHREASAELERLEHELHAFEENNAAALPGFEDMSEQSIQQAKDEREDLAQENRALEARRNELDRALADMQRGSSQFSATGESPLTSDVLSAVQARVAVLRGLYGTDYEEAVTLGAEVADAQAAAEARLSALEKEFEETQAAFNTMQREKPLDHPDVIALAHRVSKLERDVEQARVTGLSRRDRNYIEGLARERGEIDGKIDASREQLAAMDARLNERQSGAEQAPILEQQHLALQQQVADARQRQENAAAQLATLRDVLEQASRQRPGELSITGDVQITRLLMTGPSTLAAFFALLGLAAFVFSSRLTELRHRTIKGADQIMRLQGRPPLAQIPELEGI